MTERVCSPRFWQRNDNRFGQKDTFSVPTSGWHRPEQIVTAINQSRFGDGGLKLYSYPDACFQVLHSVAKKVTIMDFNVQSVPSHRVWFIPQIIYCLARLLAGSSGPVIRCWYCWYCVHCIFRQGDICEDSHAGHGYTSLRPEEITQAV